MEWVRDHPDWFSPGDLMVAAGGELYLRTDQGNPFGCSATVIVLDPSNLTTEVDDCAGARGRFCGGPVGTLVGLRWRHYISGVETQAVDAGTNLDDHPVTRMGLRPYEGENVAAVTVDRHEYLWYFDTNPGGAALYVVDPGFARRVPVGVDGHRVDRGQYGRLVFGARGPTRKLRPEPCRGPRQHLRRELL